MPRTANRHQPVVDQAAVVTKATLNAAWRLALTSKVLAAIIGVSEATVSRMHRGGYALQPGQKPFELALLFVRLYRSLDAIVGGDDGVATAWLANDNTALGARPADLIQTVSGLAHVLGYLDSRRALV